MICTLIGFMTAAMPKSLADEANPQSGSGLFEGFVYFADSPGIYLKSVKKMFPSSSDDHILAKQIIEYLIQGPMNRDLNPTWPDQAAMNSIFIADDNTAYVDMEIEPEMTAYMDCRDETLAVYSLVNSLIVNIPKIKKVKILVKGRDAATLAGHVNLEYYYKTNMLIVK